MMSRNNRVAVKMYKVHYAMNTQIYTVNDNWNWVTRESGRYEFFQLSHSTCSHTRLTLVSNLFYARWFRENNKTSPSPPYCELNARSQSQSVAINWWKFLGENYFSIICQHEIFAAKSGALVEHSWGEKLFARADNLAWVLPWFLHTQVGVGCT